MPHFNVIINPVPPSTRRQNKFLWFCHAEPVSHCFHRVTAFPQSSGAHLLQTAYQGISPGTVPFQRRILGLALRITISAPYNSFLTSSVFSPEATIISFIQQYILHVYFMPGTIAEAGNPAKHKTQSWPSWSFIQSPGGEMFLTNSDVNNH